MYALQSAAVTHTLYTACRRGAVKDCTCRQPGPDTRAVDFWKWSGCGHGLSHSGRQARRFLNARETERDARSLMNRHNNRAGVKVGHRTTGHKSEPNRSGSWGQNSDGIGSVDDKQHLTLAGLMCQGVPLHQIVTVMTALRKPQADESG